MEVSWLLISLASENLLVEVSRACCEMFRFCNSLLVTFSHPGLKKRVCFLFIFLGLTLYLYIGVAIEDSRCFSKFSGPADPL